MPYRPYPNVDRALRQVARHAQPEPAGTYRLSTRPSDHHVSWERDTTEWVDSNNWVRTEPTGVTIVHCSCGYDSGPVADTNAQATITAHLAGARLSGALYG